MVSRPLRILTYSVWMSAVERRGGTGNDGALVATASIPAAPTTTPVITFPVLPRVSPSLPVLGLMALLPCIDSRQRRFARRHLRPARERLRRRLLNGRRHLQLDLLEPLRRDAVFLQVFFVQPDRVPLPPLLEQFGRERVPRLALVVGRVAAHAKRLGDEQGGPLAAAAAFGRQPGRRIRVEHVVAVG